MKRLLFILLMLPQLIWGQNVHLKGIVSTNSGQALGSANVRVIDYTEVTVTDKSGEFVLGLPKGSVDLEITFTGYEKMAQKIDLTGDTTMKFMLVPRTEQLEEVVVSSSRYRQSDQLQTTRMSSVTLTGAEINSIPVLGGEADLLKTIQLLPGVSKGVEGSTDIFVRGGAADQNLALLGCEAHQLVLGSARETAQEKRITGTCQPNDFRERGVSALGANL